jgi:hypothetical protein
VLDNLTGRGGPDHHCKGIDKDEMPMTYALCEKTAKPSLNQKRVQLLLLSRAAMSPRQ